MDNRSDTIRLGLLRLLADNAQLTQRELAQHLGVGLGSAHYGLRALIDDGLVQAETVPQRKQAYIYLLTPKGRSEKRRITRAFLERKQAEYQAIEREIEELQQELAQTAPPECDPGTTPAPRKRRP
ncbi:MarR family EPS-associated transcriptional regulator [Thioalkalicoccus limnaeus]|uniref:MarR family EPS-associated transcriptional regulator n=1 Tax=Thioalkalicoccus limnaeus TaxID=120681 RepID=A0ABV4BLX1_9GAMM